MAKGILDPIYETFLGRANTVLNEPDAPWQQELMESVNPEKVRRQSIMRALAQASQTLATTPGNFLTGLSAAAATGADSYLTGQDQAEQDRMRAMQLVSAAQQKAEDRRLALLHDALGVKRSLQQDQIAEDERQYQRGRDAKADARQEKLDNSIIEYRSRPRGAGGSGTLSENQISVIKGRIRREMDIERRRLEERAQLDETLTPEEIESQMNDLRIELEDYYGISGTSEVPMSGKSDQQVIKTDNALAGGTGTIVANTPPPLEQRIVGKVYATQKGNFIWTGKGWKPAL